MTNYKKYEIELINYKQDKNIINYINKINNFSYYEDNTIQWINMILARLIPFINPLENDSYFSLQILKCIDLFIKYANNQEELLKSDLIRSILEFTWHFNESLFIVGNDMYTSIGKFKGNRDKPKNKFLINNELVPRIIAKCLTNNESYYDSNFCFYSVIFPYNKNYPNQPSNFKTMLTWHFEQNPSLIKERGNRNHNNLTKNALKEFYKIFNDPSSIKGLFTSENYNLSEYKSFYKTVEISGKKIRKIKSFEEYENGINTNTGIFCDLKKLINAWIKFK